MAEETKYVLTMTENEARVLRFMLFYAVTKADEEDDEYATNTEAEIGVMKVLQRKFEALNLPYRAGEP